MTSRLSRIAGPSKGRCTRVEKDAALGRGRRLFPKHLRLRDDPESPWIFTQVQPEFEVLAGAKGLNERRPN